MNIFSGVIKLTQLVLLLILVTTVFGGYDAKFQKRAVSGGLGKNGMGLRDREWSLNPILRRHNRNMQEDDNGDYDTGDDRGDPEDGDEGNGHGDNGPGQCGLRFVDNGDDLGSADRIVGGEEAAHGEFPWQVSVALRLRRPYTTDRVFNCGAVIISEFWILSAGHCFTAFKASQVLLTVGNHHLKRKDDGEQEFEVEQIIIHENYDTVDESVDDYDIALLKIKPSANGQGIQFNKYAQPVCLPDARTSFPEGTKCVVAGWGRTSADGPVSDVLLKTDSPITNHARCKELYGSGIISVTERSICAGNINGGNGACKGDSGGGLVCKTGDVYTLAGIVSAGKPCAWPEYVTVFTLVPKFIPWIRSNVQSNNNFAHSMLPTVV